ncbi:MAG TPA: hypothetical protein VEN81_06115 [Planctomycetota bacterium]|nr:hypothetical protein [Planctomycetota bacterium]
MRLVKTDEARPGQKVSRDVVDLRGNLLFKAGTALSGALLASCKERNISHLFVEEEVTGGTLSPADMELKKEAIAKDVDRMFSGADATPTMAALREASKRYLVSKLSQK